MNKEMGTRDQSVLRAIISSYISTGEPVGSRYLSKKLDFHLSSATIRNIMADLEELGFLKQPHVSAGRIPTDKAYRFFVDSFVQAAEDDPALSNLDKLYRSLRGEPEHLMREAGRALSDVSHYVGLVLAPRFIDTTFKHLEFVKLKLKTVLAIMVSEEGFIQNRLVETDREYPQRELDAISRRLNGTYADLPLREVRRRILQEMAHDKALYDSLLEQALSLGRRTLKGDESGGDDIYLEGTSNILSLPEFADLEQMKKLFQAFDDKSHLVEILGRCIDAEGVKIFIGAENPYRELHNLSVVTAPYKKEGRVFGVIGVLGPTRMEYNRVIPMVDYTARCLTRILTDRF